MADKDGGEKTEEPTSKRMKEIYDGGDFAKVPEVSAAAIVLIGFVLWRWQGEDLVRMFLDFTRAWFRELNVEVLTPAGLIVNARAFISAFLLSMSGLFGAVLFAAVVANGAQTGMRLSPKALAVKFSKVDPLKGVSKLVGKQKFVQLTIEVMKFSAIAAVLIILIWNLRDDPIFGQLMPFGYFLGFMEDAITQLSIGLLLTLTLIATVHYFWNRRVKQDEWKMTKQEVRDEHRNQEGDPMVKRARREAAMRLRQRRMLEQIPLADVVVTNPTHYAVVLKYEPGLEDAPRVIAKGARRRAQYLKKLAAQHGIPMVENRPIARGLYKRCPVGQVIPAEFFPAVAGVISFVYKHYRHHCAEVKRRRAAWQAKEGPAA
ncbi:MAG: flagellar biosynthesis protein FlhB [Opitutales bacterium]